MTISYKDSWAEDMASRVRKAYIGQHIRRAVLGVGTVSVICLGVFLWQGQPEVIAADTTAAFLLQQVEGTYSQVNPNPDVFWEL